MSHWTTPLPARSSPAGNGHLPGRSLRGAVGLAGGCVALVTTLIGLQTGMSPLLVVLPTWAAVLLATCDRWASHLPPKDNANPIPHPDYRNGQQ